MDRRLFLTTAGAASAALLSTRIAGQTFPTYPVPTAPHTPPLRAPAAVNITEFHAAGTAHSSAIANQFRGNCTAQDLINAASALSVAHNNWIAADLDHRLIPGFNQVQESWLTPTRMPIKWITENINSFNPAVTQTQVIAHLQNMFNRTVVNGVDQKTVILQQCRAAETSQIMANGITALKQIASVWVPPQISPTTHTWVPQVRPPSVPVNGGGGGADLCKGAGMAAAAMGLAAAVLTVMTDGVDILAAAAWESIAYWGGLGSVGFGLGQSMMCGF